MITTNNNKGLLNVYIIPTAMLFIGLILLTSVPNKKNSQKINMTFDVERVFMHQPNDYSVLYKEDGVIKSLRFSNGDKYKDIKLYADQQTLIDDIVKPTNPMYVKILGKYENNKPEVSVEIHIHSVAEINGGGFKISGKPERESFTTPVE